ncbi:54S ribosomal protein L1, mitochondrial [Sphaceloma murrayae]|uniref:54S ribosomal protein L1, mitochondrial n=1 Tax=Sphaceloma murrayae TaxID=2082308 RepID=A0A2K1R1N3_9PEZI|nr:54S ribosomal protein L1, mitochondrial [Sphaceloma murrayae]
MASTRFSIARPLRQVFQLSARPLSVPPPFLLPFQHQARDASGGSSKGSRKAAAAARKKKGRNTFLVTDLRQVPQFPLLDAMRYLKAAEVGQPPQSSKYEIHVRLRTLKNGPVLRSRVRLPHPVKTDVRIAVICPEDSSAAQGALKAGAVMAGEEKIFEKIKAGQIEFDQLICHPDSLQKLQKQGLGRVLGPRGLMPSTKTNTVLKDVAAAVRDVAGASEYRERLGVVRIAIGQLGYTPEELQRNIRAFIDVLKKDMAGMSDRINKEIHEIVLSSTHGPGLSLTGEFRGQDSPSSRDLAVN